MTDPICAALLALGPFARFQNAVRRGSLPRSPRLRLRGDVSGRGVRRHRHCERVPRGRRRCCLLRSHWNHEQGRLRDRAEGLCVRARASLLNPRVSLMLRPLFTCTRRHPSPLSPDLNQVRINCCQGGLLFSLQFCSRETTQCYPSASKGARCSRQASALHAALTLHLPSPSVCCLQRAHRLPPVRETAAAPGVHRRARSSLQRRVPWRLLSCRCQNRFRHPVGARSPGEAAPPATRAVLSGSAV